MTTDISESVLRFVSNRQAYWDDFDFKSLCFPLLKATTVYKPKSDGQAIGYMFAIVQVVDALLHGIAYHEDETIKILVSAANKAIQGHDANILPIEYGVDTRRARDGVRQFNDYMAEEVEREMLLGMSAKEIAVACEERVREGYRGLPSDGWTKKQRLSAIREAVERTLDKGAESIVVAVMKACGYEDADNIFTWKKMKYYRRGDKGRTPQTAKRRP